MKIIYFLFALVLISNTSVAQKGQGKNKIKETRIEKKENKMNPKYSKDSLKVKRHKDDDDNDDDERGEKHSKDSLKTKGNGKWNNGAKNDDKHSKDSLKIKKKEWDDDNGIENKKNKEHKIIKSKKVPAPVRKQFLVDYPNVNNVQWTKSRGTWTATFTNGIAQQSATYDANGKKQ